MDQRPQSAKIDDGAYSFSPERWYKESYMWQEKEKKREFICITIYQPLRSGRIWHKVNF